MINCWGHVAPWESTSGLLGLSRGFNLIHNGLRGSIMMIFLVRETRLSFVSLSKKFHLVSPIARTSQYQFSTLEKTKHGYIPLWVACWRETFHKLFMIIVVGSFLSVDADIGSLRSLLFLSHWTPGTLTSVTSLHRTYWSRGWYVRRHPCSKAHHWSRFCCDSSSSWILLRSFRHCFRAHCRTEVVDIEQAQQMIPLITRETSFG